MHKTKKLIAMLLALSMLAGMMIIPASAAVTPGISIKMESAPNGAHKLVVSATSEGLNAANVILSYDSSLIEAVSAVDQSPVNIINGGSTRKPFGDIIVDAEGYSYASLVNWVVQDNRTGFQIALAPTDPMIKVVTTLSDKPIFSFYFKTKGDLSKGSFKIETDKGAGSILSVLYKTEESLKGASSVLLSDKNGTNYEYIKSNTDTLAVNLAYTGSDKQTLGGLTIGAIARVNVPTSGTAASATPTVIGTDTDGDPMVTLPDQTWSIDGVTPTGVSIHAGTGVLTLTNQAQSGSVTIKVSAGGKSATQTITITRAAPAANKVEITGKAAITIPATGVNSVVENYSASVTDQFGEPMPTAVVDWTNAGATNGVTVENNKITVAAAATAGTVQLTATSGSATKTLDVVISLAPQIPTTLTVSGGAAEIIVPDDAASGTSATTAAFTAAVVDQYGAAYTKGTIDWTITPVTAGITIGTDGVVSVTNAAKATITNVTGAGYTVTATLHNYSTVKDDADTTLTVKRATPVATTVTVTGAADIEVPTDVIAKTETYTAVVTDQYGVTMSNQSVTWSGTANTTGVSIAINTGKVSVTNAADANRAGITYKVTASCNGKTGTKAVSIKRATAMYTVAVAGGSTSIEVPANDTPATSTAFTATVTDQYGATVTPNITWSITPTIGVSIANGVVSVAKGAKEAIADTTGKKLTVTATHMGAVGTGEITVMRAAQSPTTLTVTGGAANLEVPATDVNATTTFAAGVVDQYGAAYTGTIDWTITPAKTGVSIAGGVVTVTKEAKADITDAAGTELTVTAKVQGKEVQGTTKITVKRAAQIPTTVEITGKTPLTVPALGVASLVETYTATVKDQYGVEIVGEGAKVIWSATGATTGVKVESNKITVAPAATAGKVTLTAKSGDATGSKEVTISRAAPVNTAVKIFDGATELATADTLIIPTTGTPNTKQYSAKTYDQYGAEVSETYTWTLTPADTYVTLTGSTVSVAKGATKDSAYTLKAVGGTSALNTEITITVKDIEVDWTAVAAQDAITYGTAKKDAFTKLPATGTAKAGNVNLTGEFTILNPDVLLTKGDAQTITVQFKVTTAGAYKDIVLTKNYTVKVNPKSIANVTVGAIAPVTYNGTAHTPADLTVTDGSLPALAVTTDYTLTYASNTNAGTAKVTLTGAGNYTGTKEVSFTITPAPLTISGATVTAKNYLKGDKSATVSAVTFDGLKNSETLTKDTDYTVTASFADANAGANKAVTGTVTLVSTDKTKNYTLNATALPDSTKGTINKIAYETSVTAAKNVLSSPFATGNLDYTFDLTNLTGLPTDGGTLGYAYKEIGGTTAALIVADPAPTVSGTTLSFTATPQVKETTATISVTVSSTNYIDFDAVVTVKSVDKEATVVEVTQEGSVYGTALKNPTYTKTLGNGGAWTLSYAGVDGTSYGPNASAPTAAGTYTVTATYEDDTYYGTKTSANFTIAKKALTITDGTYTATKVFDGTKAAPTATGALGVEGKVGEDSVTLSVTSVPAYDAVDVGSYTLALPVTLDDTSAKNYTIPATYSFTKATITAKNLSAATIADIVAVTYDNTAKTPAPEVKIALSVETTINTDTDYTVAYSNNTNAGTATVTVTGKGNYTGEKAKDFTINKADRTLTLDKDALTLTLGALTGTVTGTTSTDLDKSAVITYTSANPALATVNRQGAITAVGNGTVNITVAIAAKSNYNEVSKTCAVTAVVKPVTAVVVAGGTAAQLTATVKDTTITVSGMMTAGQDLVITPTNAAGVTGDAVTIAAVDAAKLTAGGSYVATITTGSKTVTYTIVTSSVKLIPANVKLPETVPEVAPVPTELPDNANVSAALSDTTKTKLDGLMAAVGNAIDQAMKLLAEKKAELDAAFAGGYEAKVEVFPKITVTGHTSNGATGSLTLDIAPFMQISATGTGHADVELQAATQVDNTNLTAPVLVQIAKGSMTLPDDNLFAKHQLAGGKFEYLPVTYDGSAKVYSWWTTSFSSFELYSDARSATITYTFEDGTTKVVTYTPADIGTSLPSDVKSGNTFSGWTINGVTYTQLTDAALTAISGSHAATGNFTPINNNSSSSGSVAPKGETVKNPDGSTTTTITDKKTGTVTATTKFPDGSKSVVETKKDGTVATTDTRKDGLKAETVTTPEGVTTATVTVPRNVGSTQVSLPVKDAKPGTIAVLIKADGTKEIIKKSVAKDGKVTFPIDASAKIEIIDNSKSFEDVKENDWFAASVAFASAHELFSGTGEKIFDPTADMNRGMLITVMHRLENLPKGGDVNFDDVPAGAYYAEAAAWAKEAKIVTGTGAGLDPDANVTRESLAVMLYRYAKVEKSTGDLTKFVDGDKISSWAADAMSWAVQAGILQGAGGALNPAGNATRAEVATMMQRFVEFTVK